MVREGVVDVDERGGNEAGWWELGGEEGVVRRVLWREVEEWHS